MAQGSTRLSLAVLAAADDATLARGRRGGGGPAQRPLHPLRRQPGRPPARRRRPSGSPRPPGSRGGRPARSPTSCATSSASTRSRTPKTSCRSRRGTRGRSSTRSSRTSSARCSAARSADQPGPSEPWSAVRSGPHGRDRRAGLRPSTRLEGSPVGPSSGARTRSGSSPTCCDSSRTTIRRPPQAHGTRPLAAELAFGLPGVDLGTVALDLPDGRSVQFRGKADRVDVARRRHAPRRRLQDGQGRRLQGPERGQSRRAGPAAAAAGLRPGRPPAPRRPRTRRCGPSTGSSRRGAASSASATRSRPTCWRTSARPSATDGGRHRGGRLSPSPHRIEHDALGRVPVLRSRRHGGGRAAPSVRAQAGRSGHGRLRRPGRPARGRPRPRTGPSGGPMPEQVTAARDAVPPDQAARDRITEDLDTTLFVEAGAGSGKTSALVERVLALVHGRTGRAPPHRGHHLHRKGRGRAARSHPGRAREGRPRPIPKARSGTRCRVALDQLDGAAIGTLHSFAQRLLSEHPVEAGLPPRVEVLDEVSSTVAFDARWSSFRDQLLADPALERTVLLLFAAGVRPDAPCSRWPRPSTTTGTWSTSGSPRHAPDPPSVRDLFGAAVAAIRDVCARAVRRPGRQAAGAARRDRQPGWPSWRPSTTSSTCSRPSGRRPIRKLPSFKVGGRGKKASWDCDLDDLRARVVEAGEALEAVRAEVANACAGDSAAPSAHSPWPAPRTASGPGQLEFHDLLVLARALLRDPDHGPAVRAALHERYDRLLLDEFQDTDPIQIELAVRIAAADPRERRRRGASRGTQVDVAPGHLFVVGDPKQSIYRFRRADISTFLRAAERFGAEGGGVVELTANFRTVAPIIDWVNHTFAALMSEPRRRRHAGAARSPRTWPWRRPGSRRRTGPAGGGPRPPRTSRRARTADELRAAEADEVAATVTRVIDEGWDVSDKDGTWRPARLGRHHRPGAGPDVAALPRGRLRPGRYRLSGRDQLAGLRQPGRARPAHGAAGRRRPDQLPPHRLRAAHAAAGAAATTTSSASSGSAGGAGTTWPTSPTPCRSTIPVRAGLSLPARRSTTSARGSPRPSCSGRIARDRRAMELGLRRGSAPRRVAAAALRHRPGPGLERGHRRQPAPVPALGRPCRRPKAPGWPSRSCPRATTTPCGS